MQRSALFCVAGMFILLASCASKPKQEVENAGGGKWEDIQARELSFDPNGSDTGRIQGLSTVHFDFDSSQLSTDIRALLVKNANWLKGHPELGVEVQGHCDDRGSVEYNLALGERRAQAVARYLIALGIGKERVSTISYGKERPLASGDSEEAYQKNRRANFVPRLIPQGPGHASIR